MSSCATVRLKDVLSRLRGAGAAAGDANSTPVEVLVRKAFLVPEPGTRQEVFEIYQSILRLIDRSIDEARAILPELGDGSEEDEREFVEVLEKIRYTFTGAGLNTRYGDIIAHSPNEIRYHALLAKRRFRGIDGDVGAALAKLDEALAVIESSEASDALKQVFRDAVARMKRSVDRVNHFGAEEVAATFADVSVALYTNPEAQSASSSDEKIKAAIHFVAEATTVVVNSILIAKLLLLPGAAP